MVTGDGAFRPATEATLITAVCCPVNELNLNADAFLGLALFWSCFVYSLYVFSRIFFLAVSVMKDNL